MPKFPKVHPTTRQVFTVMVMLMWASSFIADMANPTYDPPAYVNPLIMLVGGYLFATASNSNGNKEKNKTPTDEEKE